METLPHTGRPVAEIAQESFALTLWTWAELRAIQKEASIERLGERTDMAGQMAIAFHQPQDLQKMELRYLKAAGKLSEMFDQARQRSADMIARLQTLTPQEP